MTITRTLAALAALAAGPATAERALTFGYQMSEADNFHQGALAATERLEELSGGELTLTLFPNAQLGDFKAMVAQVQAGELDMTVTGYPDMSYVIPELNLVGAPYAVEDFEHLQRVVDGPFGQRMDERFAEEGIRMIDLWYQGTRQTTSNRPIESLDDMAGLRMRTPNVPFLIAYAENTGAAAAPVAFQEVYLALQTNQVDAQENPLPTIEAMKFYEVQDHIALTNHFVASLAVMVGAQSWEGLTEEERGWLTEAIEHGGEVADGLSFEDEEKLVAFFEEEGLTVTRPDTAPFREAMRPYYDELEAQFGEGAMDEIIEP